MVCFNSCYPLKFVDPEACNSKTAGKSAFNIGQYGFFFSALAQKENRWAAAMCNLGQLTGSYLAVTSLTIFKTPTQWVIDLFEFLSYFFHTSRF